MLAVWQRAGKRALQQLVASYLFMNMKLTPLSLHRKAVRLPWSYTALLSARDKAAFEEGQMKGICPIPVQCADLWRQVRQEGI